VKAVDDGAVAGGVVLSKKLDADRVICIQFSLLIEILD